MTTSTAIRSAARSHGLAAAVTAAAGRLSNRIHRRSDAQARAAGWEITRTPGRAGLTGRTYRDPRFAARTAHAGRMVTPEGRRAA